MPEPMELTYAGIKGLPSRTLTSYLECAGYRRALPDTSIWEQRVASHS